MTDRVFVDTNVWVYAVDGAEPVKQARAREIVAAGQGRDIAISTQVLGEFYVVTTRKLAVPLPEDEAAAMVDRLSGLHVVSVDSALVASAVAGSREWRLSFWDALIVRAAESAGCRIVLSEDLADDRDYGSVVVQNPFV